MPKELRSLLNLPRSRPLLFLGLFLALTGLIYTQWPSASGTATPAAHDEKSGDHAEEGHGEEPAVGAHGGSLYGEQALQAEVLLNESSGEPRLSVWVRREGRPVAVEAVKLQASLKRPTQDQPQALSFQAVDGALQSREAIAEPHAFALSMVVEANGQTLRFEIHKEEGVVVMDETRIQAAGIGLDAAGPATVASSLQLPGEIRFDDNRTAHVVPRVAGVVERVAADLGQAVKRGQVLAVISSAAISDLRSEQLGAAKRLELARANHQREKALWEAKVTAEQDYLQAQQALREAEIALANTQHKLSALGATPAQADGMARFELRAPFDGTIVEKHLAVGEAVREDAQVFTLSDLRQVWAEVNVPAQDLPTLKVGAPVHVSATAFDSDAEGVVATVGSLIGEQTRVARARISLPNPQGIWRPGLFVNVVVRTGASSAPVTVVSEAIQKLGDKTPEPVVFVRVEEGFVAQPVELGRSDGQRTEVLSGLRAGQRYATTGSFVLKSELGKASAEHGH